jgi:hypothetical protein
MSKVIEYKNRYNDTIIFTIDDSTGTVIMTRDNYTRAGFIQFPIYTWIDPSGGPFISVGDNLAETIDAEFGEFIVQEIKSEDNKWIFTSPHSTSVKKVRDYMNQVESMDYNPYGNSHNSSEESTQSGEEGTSDENQDT